MQPKLCDFRTRTPMKLTHSRRAGTSRVAFAAALLAALIATVAIDPGSLAAYEVKGIAGRELELRSPWAGAIDDESSIILGWLADPGASEYIVFVSTTGLEGRDADELLADPAVTKKTVEISSVRLQDVLRGPAGTTVYSWAVAARNRESSALTLSPVSTFSAVKSFQGGTPATPLIRERARGTAPVAAYGDGNAILLANNLRFDPVVEGEPELPAALTALPIREGETGSYLVQLSGPVRDGQREALAAAGATVFSYVPNYAFIVRMPGEAKGAVEALAFVRWVGAYHPAYRVSAQREMNETAGTRVLQLLLFPDADLNAASKAIAALGGEVLEATDSGVNKMMRISVDMARVSDIASRNDVVWVEPWHEMVTENSTAQWIVQTNSSLNRRVWDMGINGQGQVVHTSDSGIRTSHNQFRDPALTITNFGDFPTHRKVIAYKRAAAATSGITFGDAAGAAYHGTHTAGSICGNDSTIAADARDGNAKGAKIYFHDGGAAANTITAPGDLNIMFNEAYIGNGGGAPRVSSNSWGADNGGAYDLQGMTADQFMWTHKDFLHFFSNGNAGGANTVGTPATNKNGVGAGGSLNSAASGSIYTSTSRGPTDDGRRKPTICAPASTVSSANGAGDTGYAGLSGTSMSSPTMAGATALIRQYLTDGWYPTGAPVGGNGFNPSGALLKAMAIASTDNDMTGFNIPDNNVGWGRIKVDNILFFPADTRRLALVDDNDGLATGEFVEYEINVTDTSIPVKIALVWVDKEGSPTAARQLVNDLDLTVTDPAATVYKGNVFASGQSTTGGNRDSLNVEEGVRRNIPVAGIWTIRVAATNAPFSPQPFALVVSGGMGGDNGVLQIDKLTYGQDDVIEIRVEDNNASSPITVNVSSDTETTPEAVSIAGVNGVFAGTIGTTAFSAAKVAADGLISLTHGDDITVSYSDASPVAIVEANATADFTGPVITNVSSAAGTTANTIARTATWTTDVLATSRVFYGLSPALGSASPLDSALTTSHALVLTGLLPDTTYYFDVESADHGGNTTRADNGGNHFRLTTGKRGDVLLVIGDPTFEKTNLYVTSLNNRGWDYNLLSGGTIINPPVGDKTFGLRSYKAVWWQVGYEQYPCFENATRDSLEKYHNGGGRLSVVSHDVAWSFSDPTSGYQNAVREAWVNNFLHIDWQADPLTWTSIVGIAADPISGTYTGGMAYAPHRDGAAGDEINLLAGTGTANYVWRNNEATVDDIAVRWVNGVNNGSPDSAFWGGTPTRVVTNCLEWAQITSATARDDLLDNTLIWLLGHDHPDVAVTAPNGGETITTSSTNVTWTEATFGGTNPATRKVLYSSDGGSSWNVIATGVTSPYSWDVSALPNGAEYRVRVVLTDDGTPALDGRDDANANFTIDRLGGDNRGPVVIAGSITSNPNPMDNGAPSTLFATVTDIGNGGSNVTQAEWSVGVAPAAAGFGNAMTGAFAAATEPVSATIGIGAVSAGQQTFWVRGRDAAGNWGGATALEIVVNGTTTGIDGIVMPSRFALEQNSPNPFNPATVIRYALPKESDVQLLVYNASGQVVRTLANEVQGAGFKTVMWDGRNDAGKPVTSGVYMYKLEAGDFAGSHKMVLVK